MYDIIVVGGGPAGATAARKAKELGLDVICIEKAKMPRVKPCGGGIPEPAFPILNKFREHFDSYSAGVIFIGPQEEVVERTDITAGAFVIRSTFDQMLLQEAKKEGVKVVEGEKVADFKISKESVMVRTVSQDYEGRILFGADGVNSVIAKRTGLNPRWHPKKVVLAYVNETEVGEKRMDEVYTTKRKTIFHLGFKDSVGYGWIFPKKRHVNVGFGGILADTPNGRSKFQQYISKCQADGILPAIDPKNTTAALVPMCGPIKCVYKERALLLGDAGGFVNPANGEGIHYAIQSGIIAAEVAAGIIKDSDYRLRRFKLYQDRCMEEFGKQLRWFKLAHTFGIKRITRLLDYSKKDVEFGHLFLNILLSTGFERKWELIKRYLVLRAKDIFA